MTPDILNSISTARYSRQAYLGQIVNTAAATIAGGIFRRRSGSSRHVGGSPAGSRS